MRAKIRKILRAATSPLVGGLLISFFDLTCRRILWAWGHIRFAALVRNQGEGCVCHWNVELKFPERLTLGNRVIIGTNCTLGAAGGIVLEDNVRLSRDVVIETAGLKFDQLTPPYGHIFEPIHIEAGAWIGARALVLGGVRIGRNAVVAAGSIVSKSVPEGAVVAGVPAKVIRIKSNS
jgi:maltose O-acetyltransferase